jgi:tetratricopeptide (TPR) repeat protein
MCRLLFLIIASWAVLTFLGGAGVLPPHVEALAWDLMGTVWCVAALVLLSLYWAAPGLFQRFDITMGFVAGLGSSRREAAELLARIDHMGKPHHMAQLGHLYLAHGRPRKAAHWLERALELDPQLLDARYRLAQCHLSRRKVPEATELFEQVYATKPDHDYGMLYLRLAQCHQRLGNDERAREIFQRLLRFYPGHPEGSYHFALLEAQEGDRQRASELMRGVITTVARSPRFQRRRNRHWAWKARWWLWTKA